MIEIAYIQKQDGEFINASNYQAWEGFKFLGIRTEFFDYQQLIRGYLPIPLNKNSLVCGFISSVRWALQELQIPEPIISDYPLELENFLGRRIHLSTLGEVKRSNQKIFIKPLETKLFKGIVCHDSIQTLIETALHPDETKIYVSEPINFVSEYRVFVNQGLMVGCKHYLGDFTITPDFDIISQAILRYNSYPIAYAADFGITSDGQTLLIEINDAWSLGSYGLDSKIYANMLLHRWIQMMENHESNTSIS